MKLMQAMLDISSSERQACFCLYGLHAVKPCLYLIQLAVSRLLSSNYNYQSSLREKHRLNMSLDIQLSAAVLQHRLQHLESNLCAPR